MKQPGEYDIVHPIWQRGRDWGIYEERQRIIKLLKKDAYHRIRLFPKDEHADDCHACELLKLLEGENE